MALRDRHIGPRVTGRGYRIDEIRGLLDTEDLEVLDRWLADPTIGSKRIAAEVSAEGYNVSPNAVATYRRKVLEVDV